MNYENINLAKQRYVCSHQSKNSYEFTLTNQTIAEYLHIKNNIAAKTLAILASSIGVALSARAGNFGINTFIPGSQLSVKGNLSVGSADNSIAAPASGALFEGKVAVGTSTPDPLAQLHLFGPNNGILVVEGDSKLELLPSE